jgi:CRP-like cAMP-binding protein
LRLHNYGALLRDIAGEALRLNRPFAEHLRSPEVDARVARARAEYRISDEQHADTLRSLAGTASPVLARAEHLLREIADRTVLRHHLQAHALLRGRDSARLLARFLQERRETLSAHMIATLALGEPGFDLEIAQALYLLAGDVTPTLCITANTPTPLSQGLREVLSGAGASPAGRNAFRLSFGQSDSLEELLARAAGDPDPWMSAVALQVLAVLNVGRARDLLEQSNALVGAESWLLEEIRQHLQAQHLQDGTIADATQHPGKLELLAWLAALEPFAGVRLEVLRMLLPELRFQRLSAGDYLCRQHDRAADIYLVFRGAVSAWRKARSDGRPQQVGSFEPGQMAGEVSVLLQRTHNATLRADAGGAAIVAINGRALRRLSHEHPNIAEYLLDRAVGHLQTFIGATGRGVQT